MRKTIIIVESGATKSDWCAVSPGRERFCVKTPGINLATMSLDVVREIVREAFDALAEAGFSDHVSRLYFYAAGLIVSDGVFVPPQAMTLHAVLTELFPGAVTEYASDLLAAARSVCGNEPGIAVILGTGSNNCLYDGERIVKNVLSGGFILGDEGGGARLGKMFMSDFLKGLVPEPVAGEFASTFEVDYMTVVRNVYKGGAPAGYLGSFAPWITARYDTCDYIKELVERNFRDFIERVLRQYDTTGLRVGVVGGFGCACRAELERLGAEYGLTFSRFIPSPMEGLIAYHGL